MTGENKKEQELPKGYRLLERGEVIRNGDIYQVGGVLWRKAGRWGMKYNPDTDWLYARQASEADSVSRTKPAEMAHLFGELMAIIHGDGGHYLSKHGHQKAYNDAVEKYYETRKDEPADSASVIPQSPVSDLESEWTVEKLVATKTCTAWSVRSLTELIGVVDRFDQAHSITLKHNASLRQLREQKEEAERKRFISELSFKELEQRERAEYLEIQEYLVEIVSLHSSLLQHESVIEKMREALILAGNFVQYEKEIWPTVKKALALQPSPSHLAAWFQEKVKPLVEALEKLTGDRWSPAINEISRSALAQHKPETKP